MLRRSFLWLGMIPAVRVAHAQKQAQPQPQEPAADPGPAGITPVTGHAAKDSAPARAFSALLQAAARDDFAAMRPMLVDGHPGLRLLNPQSFSEVRAELLPNGAAPPAVMATLSSLYLQNDEATLVFDGDDGQTIWKMKRVSGVWKLAP